MLSQMNVYMLVNIFKWCLFFCRLASFFLIFFFFFLKKKETDSEMDNLDLSEILYLEADEEELGEAVSAMVTEGRWEIDHEERLYPLPFSNCRRIRGGGASSADCRCRRSRCRLSPLQGVGRHRR